MSESKVWVKHIRLNKEFSSFQEAVLYLNTRGLNIYDKNCRFYSFNKKENRFNMKNPIHLFPNAKTKKPFFSSYLSKQDYFNTDPITFTEDTKNTIEYLDDLDHAPYFNQIGEADQLDFEINHHLVDFN